MTERRALITRKHINLNIASLQLYNYFIGLYLANVINNTNFADDLNIFDIFGPEKKYVKNYWEKRQSSEMQ